MLPTVFASFNDPEQAQRLIGSLLEAGIAPEDLSVVIKRDTVSDPDSHFHESGIEMVDAGEGASTMFGEAAVQTEGSYTYESRIGGGISTSNADDAVSGVEEMDDSQLAAEEMTYPASAQSFSSQERFDVAQGANTGFFNTTRTGPKGLGGSEGNVNRIAPGDSNLTSLMVPGLGLVIGDGSLATSVIGAGIATEQGGNPAADLKEYLKDQAVPNEVAWMLSKDFEEGGAVVSIAAPPGGAEYDVIQQVLESGGAKNVHMIEASD